MATSGYTAPNNTVIESNKVDIAALNVQNVDIKTVVDGSDTKIDDLSTDLAANSGQNTIIESKVDTLDAKMVALDTKIDIIDANVDQVVINTTGIPADLTAELNTILAKIVEVEFQGIPNKMVINTNTGVIEYKDGVDATIITVNIAENSGVITQSKV